ncbi:hypothetical protein [Pyrococcus kukulkanii]|uniref:ArsR family transcriptional regulator n=1 Tax=Pyrococcus kukulkanii TaxID=1609559 RepID=A0ABV4T7J5_9EURY
MLVVLVFEDPKIKAREEYLVKTDLNVEELWDKIQEALQELDEDWTYDDIIEKLHEKGYIEYVEDYRVYEYEL